MSGFVGRESEFKALSDALGRAAAGAGSCVLISGEPGIGKSRLIDEAKARALALGFAVLEGACAPDGAEPLLPFSKALGTSLALGKGFASFSCAMLLDGSGNVAVRRGGSDGLDTEALARMLSTVQEFVRDSFRGGGSLGLLEHAGKRLLVERAGEGALAAVVETDESPEMRLAVKAAADAISRGLESAGGVLESLSTASFALRKDLEGVKLENERIRIANGALDVLRGKSAVGPILLVVEDAHWADESSLFVLGYLGRNMGGLRCLLLATARPSEGAAAQKALAAMRGDGSIADVALTGLDLAGVRGLVDSTLGPNDFPPQFAERMHRDCAGNPFFVSELLRQMAADGAVASRGGVHTIVEEDYAMPSSVAEVVERRLRALDPDAMAFAERASCIGREFPLGAALSAPSVDDPEAALAKLEAAAIVARGGEFAHGTVANNDGAMVSFTHALFQSAVYGSLAPRWRSAHHRSIGEWYERAYTGREGEASYELARHFSLSAEHEKAYRYCVLAGENAEASYAMETAVEFYESALKSLSESGSKALDVLERVGGIRMLLGEYDRAMECFLKVRAESGDREVEARMTRNVGDLHERRGEYERAIAAFAQAKELSRPGSVEYARILCAEGIPHWRMGDNGRAMALFDEAIRTVEGLDADRRVMGNAQRAIGNIHYGEGDYEKAMLCFEKSLVAMESAGDEGGIAAALNNMGIVHHVKGDLDRALESHERGLEIKERTGDVSGIAFSLFNIGVIHADRSELGKALDFYTRSLEIAQRIGDMQGVASSLKKVGEIHYHRGDLAKAQDFYERSLAIAERIGDMGSVAYALSNIGDVHLGRGDPVKALEFFSRSLGICEEIEDVGEAGHGHCSMAEAYVATGELDKAQESLGKAMEISTRTESKWLENKARYLLGAVHRGGGGWGGAGEELKRSLAIIDEIGDLTELGRAHYEFGLLHRAMGEGAKAAAAFERALAEFSKAEMKLWAERAKKALDG